MTSYAPPPTGGTAADLLAWWQQRARTDRVATSYYTACDMALSELGSESQLREISALTLYVDDLARRAADGCWLGLSESARHHQTLRLRRALSLFSAALRMYGGAPAATSRLLPKPAAGTLTPAVLDGGGEDSSLVAAPEPIAHLVSDEWVLSAATAVLDAASSVAASTSLENLAALSAAISALETALAEAGVAPERIPATAAALTAYIHRRTPRR
ncbi:hypothetical protein KGQ19_00765 [Catenulispora sp. NL8]|uniref:Uncharacterized protein n=1 Tax=Catenulispora pinistramenti TaxID=2705254 RepID=A0ABS5KJX7_9ACTN|nr:hypothetical protein [Catenulispora pinistramenti]MBS2545391.1 hypothetical protein [Catenulispora pinistramenti]